MQRVRELDLIIKEFSIKMYGREAGYGEYKKLNRFIHAFSLLFPLMSEQNAMA